MPVRNRDALELRAVAPLVVTSTRELIAPVLLVTNGTKTMGMTNAELLRPWEPGQISILANLDGSVMVPIANWGLGRYSAVGLVELGGPVPASSDVEPLPIASVCASSDTRGAPSAIAGVARGWTTPLRYGYVMPTASSSLLRPSTGSGGNQV